MLDTGTNNTRLRVLNIPCYPNRKSGRVIQIRTLSTIYTLNRYYLSRQITNTNHTITNRCKTLNLNLIFGFNVIYMLIGQ